MTPPLAGRWQTRLVMLATLGLLVTLIFALVLRDARVLAVLLYVIDRSSLLMPVTNVEGRSAARLAVLP